MKKSIVKVLVALALAMPVTIVATTGTSDARTEICWINNTNDYGSGCTDSNLSCADLGMDDGEVTHDSNGAYSCNEIQDYASTPGNGGGGYTTYGGSGGYSYGGGGGYSYNG